MKSIIITFIIIEDFTIIFVLHCCSVLLSLYYAASLSLSVLWSYCTLYKSIKYPTLIIVTSAHFRYPYCLLPMVFLQ